MLKIAVTAVAIALVAVAPHSQATVAGDWDASYETPGGARSFRVVFAVEGEKLTGTVKRPSGEVPLTGTVVKDSVKFSYSIEYNGRPLAMNVSAQVAGDSMKGQIDFAGQAQEPFQATRVPAKP